MHCRIHYSLLTVVLFVKLDLHKIVTTLKRIHEARKFQHTVNVLAFMAALKMSTRWRSWRHIMPTSDLYCFATVLQDRRLVRELQSFCPLEEAGPVCSENDKCKIDNQTDQSLAMKQKFVI